MNCHSDREAFLLRRGIFLSFRQRSFFASTRNLFVIPTEKLFLLRRGIFLSFRQRSFWLRRGIFLFSKGIDSSVAKSSFRMTVASCHSDREAFFASSRNLNVIPTKKFFCFDEESFFSRDLDSSIAKSSFRMTAASCHSDKEAFWLCRGIFRTSTFKILQSPIGSFRMTVAKYFSMRVAFSIHEIQILAKYITFVLWMQKPYKHL